MKRNILIVAMVMLAVSVSFAAGGAKKEGGKKVASGGKEITLKGKILKFEKQQGKNGKMQVSHYLFQADGFKVKLPEKGESVNLDELTGRIVELVVQGTDTEKDGVRDMKITRIVSAKPVEDGADGSTNAPAAVTNAPVDVPKAP
ncbi:MAG: hypothetical protein WCN95_04525 [bacterium]